MQKSVKNINARFLARLLVDFERLVNFVIRCGVIFIRFDDSVVRNIRVVMAERTDSSSDDISSSDISSTPWLRIIYCQIGRAHV